MSKRPSLSNIENEGCSSEKQQRTSDTINLSPACKEKMSTFKASAETILQNIKLQTELAAIKEDHEILKNDYTKLEKLSEDYISTADKVMDENERLEEEHTILQNQISEIAETLKDEQAKNDKLKTELDAEEIVCDEAKKRAGQLQDRIPALYSTIRAKNGEILDLRAQLEEETENLEESQNELVQANLKIETIQRELQDVKKQLKDDSTKFQKRIDEAAEELCNKEKENERKLQDVKDESENLRKRIDQVTGERDKQIKNNQEILDALNKKENELAASVKLKDDEIADLNGQLNMQKEFYGTKVKELQKLQTKLEASEAKSARFQSENSTVENKCATLEQQIERQKSATAQENASWAKMDKEKEAALSKVERENEELKKSLENSENERAKTKKHIEDRAKELFEEWKKTDGTKKDKENNREHRHIQKPEEKLNNDRKVSRQEANVKKDSNWDDLLKLYESMFLSSNSSATTFLDLVAEKHFSRAEKMQPISEMNEKMKEIEEIFDHFFSNDKEENRKSQLKNLRSRMNTKRHNAKQMEFKKCNTERCVAFTSDGNRFYYFINTKKKPIIWNPYEDKERGRYIRGNHKPEFASFLIPNQYSHCEYKTVKYKSFQNWTKNGQKGFKL